MTIVVWDGRTLAADKMAINADLKRKTTKIRMINGNLCAVSGDWDFAQELYAWFERGAKPEEWPAFQKDDQKWVSLLVITPQRQILKYERSPYPMDFTEDGVFAMGSGRDFAMGAIALGATAEIAVEVASKLCSSCGLGVDTLRFPGGEH